MIRPGDVVEVPDGQKYIVFDIVIRDEDIAILNNWEPGFSGVTATANRVGDWLLSDLTLVKD